LCMSYGVPKKITSEKPISVRDYISLVNELLKRIEVKVIGEVSGLKKASSGHLYFSLRDEKTGDVINCAIWSSVYRMCGVDLEEGMQVIISGTADIYRERGTFTFKVRTVEPVGEGALKKAYDELKEKLSREGLFDEEKKREVPEFPKKVGLITSKKGAAIHDFINNLEKVGFKVYICDTRVEGQEAVEDLLLSLKRMRKEEVDVLVITRGGGSLQSLLAFDNEMLVREIADFPVPVIAGIGHHEDITLSALAADKALSTPTATANFLTKGYQSARENVFHLEGSIKKSYENVLYRKNREFISFFNEIAGFFREILEEYRSVEDLAKRSLLYMKSIIEESKKNVVSLGTSISNCYRSVLQEKREKIDNISQLIRANDPKRQLSLGYAIVRKKGRPVKSVREIKKEDSMETSFFDGEAVSEVKEIKKKKYG